MYNVIIMEINEILRKNLEYIKIYDEDLSNRLVQINSINDSVQLIYTQKGEANLACNGIAINEQTGAVDEAKRIVASLSHNNKSSIHIVMGMGFGYLFNEIVEYSKGSVILYEPNLMLLRVALEMVDMSSLLSKKRVFITDDLTMLEKHFGNCYFNRSKTAVLACNYYRVNNKNDNKLALLVEKLGRLQGIYQSNEEQRASFGGGYAFNVCRNLDILEKCYPISELQNSLKNCPAVIAAAGPGLGENLDIIKEFRDKFVLFSVSSSFATLMKNEIKPDFVSIIEKFDSTGLVKNYALDDISLITEPYLNLNVLELPFKKKIISSSVENSANSIYNKLLNIPQFYFETKGTVSYNALYAAMYMGCNPIILVGQDLAYIDGECYSKNSPLSPIKCRKTQNGWEVYISDLELLKKNLFSHKQINEETVKNSIEQRVKILNEQLICGKTKFGEDVATSLSFSLFAEYYKSFSQKYSNIVKLYNTSKKGIDIGDFEYSSLKDVLQKFDNINISHQINLNKTYKVDNQLLDKEISFISSALDEILSIRNEYFTLRDILLSTTPDIKKALEITKYLLDKFVSINEQYTNKSIVYKETTLESNYVLSGILDLFNDIDLDKLKQIHKSLGAFYVLDYVRLCKVLNTLKRVRENLKNESCITKS